MLRRINAAFDWRSLPDRESWSRLMGELPGSKILWVMLLAELGPLLVLFLMGRVSRCSKCGQLSLFGQELFAGMLATVIASFGMTYGMKQGWATWAELLSALLITPVVAVFLTFVVTYCRCRIHDEIRCARWERRRRLYQAIAQREQLRSQP